MVAVESSMINSLGYDKQERNMVVEFANGSEYIYYDVPERVFKRMKDSDSVGQYFHNKIKDQYDWAST